MSLQIDLFKDTTCTSEAARQGAQIFSRVFKLEYSLDPIDQIESSIPAFQEYRRRLHQLLDSSKETIEVAGLKADSYAELEMIGVGRYSKEYTVIVDFGDKLDFVLAELSGCDSVMVRNMPDYDKISNAFLNYKFEDVANLSFGVFMDLDPELDAYMDSLIAVSSNLNKKVKTTAAVSSYVLLLFYKKITEYVQRIQNYTARAIKQCATPVDIVYRSKTFSKIILSASKPITEKIVLKGTNAETVLDSHSYRRYEYAKILGGISCN